jgi:hypothetical protein
MAPVESRRALTCTVEKYPSNLPEFTHSVYRGICVIIVLDMGKICKNIRLTMTEIAHYLDGGSMRS